MGALAVPMAKDLARYYGLSKRKPPIIRGHAAVYIDLEAELAQVLNAVRKQAQVLECPTAETHTIQAITISDSNTSFRDNAAYRIVKACRNIRNIATRDHIANDRFDQGAGVDFYWIAAGDFEGICSFVVRSCRFKLDGGLTLISTFVPYSEN
jgi:hypothetical protein